ncbi:hypothetical protein RchiOBHm_Chr1g0349621 [Rosa chinensis]|uniref:Uncharacterized protein n=1 Tax=Rosa chinensis TaxID=74649 RepID=A0A2P6SFV7_ROSCH|nr:hypothetical protein RchiOBHm_Chr1g0349621 [Rosa chinensis]
MLSVSGGSILSWIGHDYFVVDDKTAAHHEAVGNLLLQMAVNSYMS